MIFAPEAASQMASAVDKIASALLLISGILAAAVWLLIVYFCFKYRKGSKADRSNPPQKPRRFEFGISLIVFIFGLGIFIWSSQTFYQMFLAPAGAHEIYVVSKQWMWIFHDPKGQDQINTLKVPLGEPIRLIMTSQDVIHSFYVPAFRIKQDLLPGRYTSVSFTAEKLGNFPIRCAEYCGLNHSLMPGIVQVVPAEEYRSQSDSSAETLESRGAQLFQQKACITCHEGPSPIGPSLVGIMGRRVLLTTGQEVTADDNYLRRSILDPQAEIVKGYQPVMPSFQGQLSEQQLAALIAYIKSKKSEKNP
jgi:cytochrome c oxidase subunit 2